jgi:hypothetical protein
MTRSATDGGQMASTTLFTCDFEGCMKALDEHDVTQVRLGVYSAQMPDELAGAYGDYLGLDLCDEHLDVVLARMLVSATVS